jgi:D-alanyl-D-alanine carboxypeptidase
MGRRPVVLLAGGLLAALLVAATVVWWPRDRPAVPPTGVSAPPASRAPTDPAVLQQQLDGVVEAGAPGVVGLARTGERTWQGASGLGDLRANRPARAGDRFRVGSMTKSFVAALVLQLVGEGRLSLDDNLERWLPGLVPSGERITVRQLLNHTSGLYNYSDDLPEPPRRFRPRELVAIATGHKPLFTPGTQFSYSNTNYILAGLLVERVTGQPLDDQLEQRIFQPLGLDHTELPTPSGHLAARTPGAMHRPTRIGR